MKKITLLIALIAGFVGFSQSSRPAIQTYLDANRSKLELTAADVSDWVIESEVPGSGTGITSTYIVQRYQGTEIFNAQNNVWVKNGKVLNILKLLYVLAASILVSLISLHVIPSFYIYSNAFLFYY